MATVSVWPVSTAAQAVVPLRLSSMPDAACSWELVATSAWCSAWSGEEARQDWLSRLTGSCRKGGGKGQEVELVQS